MGVVVGGETGDNVGCWLWALYWRWLGVVEDAFARDSREHRGGRSALMRRCLVVSGDVWRCMSVLVWAGCGLRGVGRGSGDGLVLT